MASATCEHLEQTRAIPERRPKIPNNTLGGPANHEDGISHRERGGRFLRLGTCCRVMEEPSREAQEGQTEVGGAGAIRSGLLAAGSGRKQSEKGRQHRESC